MMYNFGKINTNYTILVRDSLFLSQNALFLEVQIPFIRILSLTHEENKNDIYSKELMNTLYISN